MLNPNIETVSPLFSAVVLITCTALVMITGLVLVRVSQRYSKEGNWDRIVAELFTPLVLWVIFGVGGIIAIIRPVADRYDYYSLRYEGLSVLLIIFYVFIGALFYITAFRSTYLFGKSKKLPNKDIKIPRIWSRNLLIALLSFDWYVRYKLIQSGVYFKRLVSLAVDESLTQRTTSPLFHLQESIWPVNLSILLYMVYTEKNKNIYKFLLIVQFLISSITGSRKHIILSILSLLFTYMVLHRVVITNKLILYTTISIVLFFGIIGPIIQEARLQMRYDATSILKNPAALPYRFVFEYVPKAFSFEAMISGTDEKARQEKAKLVYRIGSYAAYAASIQQSMLNGTSLLGIDKFKDALLVLVPRFLYPQKPSVDADEIVYEHFGMGYPGQDATGTPIADAFAHLHVLGIILILLVAGIIYGALTNYFVGQYGAFGSILVIGMLPNFIPVGDSVATYLTDMRNVLLFFILVRLALKPRSRASEI